MGYCGASGGGTQNPDCVVYFHGGGRGGGG